MFYEKTFRNGTKCFATTSYEYSESYLDYIIGWTFFGFCIPFAIIVGCYGHVTVVICRSKTIDKNVKQQLLKLLVILILLFLFCYTPYHIFKNLSMYSRVLINQGICPDWDSRIFIMRQASRGLVSLNSALNPLVYLHVNEDMGGQFRQMFSYCFKLKSSSLPVNQRVESTIQTHKTTACLTGIEDYRVPFGAPSLTNLNSGIQAEVLENVVGTTIR
ncbi:hypothetical protein CCH79_00018677 [Gambusia affinis]|uniref:G-protein coupled receptors family 1 profile domain-containing protein n=1 Tax=Gambusia affinis TaxID=33528 RepID=A0A315VMA3_GAMAF|nr:hypothetical protein CCH79_00018677 [Gambusia affinis]